MASSNGAKPLGLELRRFKEDDMRKLKEELVVAKENRKKTAQMLAEQGITDRLLTTIILAACAAAEHDGASNETISMAEFVAKAAMSMMCDMHDIDDDDMHAFKAILDETAKSLAETEATEEERERCGAITEAFAKGYVAQAILDRCDGVGGTH